MKQTLPMNREIRPVGTDRVDEYLEIYLNAYPAFKSLDAECREYYRNKTLLDMSTDKEVDFYGMFQDDKLVALMKLVNFRMNLYGKLQPAVGLMSLAVHPLYKKQGIALSMVRFYEEYTAEKGADVAVLLPFNIGFYRKMGYGLGGRMDEYHIQTADLPKRKDLSHLRLMTMDDMDDLLACQERFSSENHGLLVKYEEEIRGMRGDESLLKVGYYEEDTLQGYAIYRFVDASETNYTMNRIEVDELIYRDGEVLKDLLGFFRNQADLAQTIILRSGEEDFYHLLPNPAHVSNYYIPYGYLQTNVSAMGNMYKILDPVRFVENTSYRRFPKLDKTVCFRYLDEMSGETSDLVVTFRDGHWSASETGDADCTITCAKSDLSALLMNCGRLASFLRLGVMEIDKPEEADVIDLLLYHNQKPFSNSDF